MKYQQAARCQTFKAGGVLALLATNSAHALPSGVLLLIDGRTLPASAPVTGPDAVTFLTTIGLAGVQQRFQGKEDWDCTQPSITGMGRGAFTRPNAKQQVYLYTVCYRNAGGGTSEFLHGIAIFEKGKVNSNTFPLDAKLQGYDFKVLPDLNRDQLNEMLLTSGGGNTGMDYASYQGVTWAKNGVRLLKTLEGNNGSCTSGRDDATESALVYWVKPGTTPTFYGQSYGRGCLNGEGHGSYRAETGVNVVK